MAAYVAVDVDPQEDLPRAEEVEDGKVRAPSAKEKEVALEEGRSREDEPLLNNNNKDLYECRICQDEDVLSNLESPCGCCGSLKYAHRKCVQYWCNEKGDTTCEICHKPYQPGYTAPPPPAREETAIDIHRLAINMNRRMDLNDPRFLTMPVVDRRYLETEYDEYPNGSIDASGAELCRSATFILLAILLLRHIFVAGDNGSDDGDDGFDLLTFFGLFFLKFAAFLLPCYIMAWTITLIARRREREAEEAVAAASFALVLQSAHARDLHLTIASPP